MNILEIIEKKRDKKNHSVYALVDLHGTAIYIGRTNNLERRKKEHKRSTNRRKLTLVPIKEKLSLDEAIIREQLEIERFKTLNKLDKRANQRNEISTKSRLYDSYIEEKIDIYNNITYVGKDWDNER